MKKKTKDASKLSPESVINFNNIYQWVVDSLRPCLILTRWLTQYCMPEIQIARNKCRRSESAAIVQVVISLWGRRREKIICPRICSNK